jgi:hypothetical protein
MDIHLNERTILVLVLLPFLAISTLFLAFGFSIYSLLTQSLNTILLMGIYWKLSDIAKERKAREEMEAIRQR